MKSINVHTMNSLRIGMLSEQRMPCGIDNGKTARINRIKVLPLGRQACKPILEVTLNENAGLNPEDMHSETPRSRAPRYSFHDCVIFTALSIQERKLM